MRLSLPGFITSTWERNEVGDNFYDLTAAQKWTSSQSNAHFAQNHPILTPAILFVAKLFSQAFIEAHNERTDKVVKSNVVELLKKPNAYQTQIDFLESLMFMMITHGVAICYGKKITGFKTPEAIYVLDPTLIKWPELIRQKIKSTRDLKKFFSNQTVKYDEGGENLDIKISDLLFFYDLPNCMNRNPFHVRSRLDGLKQTLINTQDSLLAKNIILKSNGKEMITITKDGFPLGPDEKKDAQALFNDGYGLGFNRKRGLLTKASLNWQSLHIALRDLGLDESIKIDGNLIYTALHIPKDILSLEAKKTTYNNFKESMVSYIQNEMYSSINAVMQVFQQIESAPNVVLKGTYEHLPVMQFVLIEKYQGISNRAKALNDLLRTGIPNEIALEICGFDKSLELNEIQELNGNSQGQQSGSNEQTGEEAD